MFFLSLDTTDNIILRLEIVKKLYFSELTFDTTTTLNQRDL